MCACLDPCRLGVYLCMTRKGETHRRLCGQRVVADCGASGGGMEPWSLGELLRYVAAIPYR